MVRPLMSSIYLFSLCVVEDVLKARLKTLGVVEHQFAISMGTMRGASNWVIYDVGGARNQRHAWAPYFQDGKPRLCTLIFFFRSTPFVVNAIIFLAPISAFDQVLTEVGASLYDVTALLTMTLDV
jgi:hypothetical protein